MPVQNGMTNVYNMLMEMLETVTDPDVRGEELDVALARAKAASGLSGQIIGVAKLSLDAAKLQQEYGSDAVPEQFRIERNKGS